jgi:protein PsiE
MMKIPIKMRSEQSLTGQIRQKFDHVINMVELAVLILIGLATASAMVQETWKVLTAGSVSLTDLLLMFLYLEVLAMDARYLRLGQLPVRFPLYIAMASLARDLILKPGDIADQHVLLTALGIAVLAVSAFVLRVGQHHYPARDDEGRDELIDSSRTSS